MRFSPKLLLVPTGVIVAFFACRPFDELTNGQTNESPPIVITPAEGGDGTTPAVRRACLDRPSSVEKAPSAGLPCDLLPPGLTL